MGYGIKNMLLPTENPKMQTMIDELNIEKEHKKTSWMGLDWINMTLIGHGSLNNVFIIINKVFLLTFF